MNKGLVIVLLLLFGVLSVNATNPVGVSPGASTGRDRISPGASSGRNTQSPGSSQYADARLSIVNTVDNYKAPAASAAPRTTINTGTPIHIDNDLTEDNDPHPHPDVNSGVRARPDIQADSPTGD